MTATVVLVRAGGGPAWERALESLREHLPGGATLVELDAPPVAAAAAAAPADVVLVDRPVLVGAGWLEGLAAGADSTVATVSPLLLAGAGPAPPRRDTQPSYPRLEEEPAACRLVRRAALELAGPLDDAFCARCSALGLTHVVADDVVALLPAAGDETPPAERSPLHERPPGALERARLAARRQLDGLSVTIDGRALGDSTAGTQVQTLALLRALHATGGAALRVVLPPEPSAAAREALAAMPGVEAIDGAEVPRGTARTHVVHRPYQLTSADDLVVLRRLGHRVVVTHQDSILYHACAYHAGAGAWREYRRLTADGLAAADLVVTISRHAERDLLADDLVDPARLRVVAQGVDHVAPGAAAARPPEGADAVAERPFVLCVGTDLPHKNRRFAIALVEEMRERGWTGALVLAGPHVEPGGTFALERDQLAARADLTDAVVDLGPVDEAGKEWLYDRAEAVVYPTLYEGFGLIPFEAAAAGKPALFAPQASLAELLDPAAALLLPWDAAASAQRALALLADPEAVREQVERVRSAGRALTWRATAERLIDVYEQALRLPSPPAAVTAWRALEAQEARSIAEGTYWAFRNEIGDTGLALVGEQGALPDDVQRSLAALSRRAATRGPLFALLRVLRRLAHPRGR